MSLTPMEIEGKAKTPTPDDDSDDGFNKRTPATVQKPNADRQLQANSQLAAVLSIFFAVILAFAFHARYLTAALIGDDYVCCVGEG